MSAGLLKGPGRSRSSAYGGLSQGISAAAQGPGCMRARCRGAGSSWGKIERVSAIWLRGAGAWLGGMTRPGSLFC